MRCVWNPVVGLIVVGALSSACGGSSGNSGTATLSSGLTDSDTATASASATTSGTEVESGEEDGGDDEKLDVALTDLPGAGEADDGSIDESTCEGAAMALTSVGCLFTTFVGNAVNGLSWAVIAANTNENPANVALYAPNGTLIETVSVPGQGLHVFEFDGVTAAMYQHTNATGQQLMAMRIEADAPIVAYQYQPYSSSANATSDGSLLLPEHAWGDNYLAAGTASAGNNWLTVISLSDGVNVTVRRPAGAPGSTAGGGAIPALAAGDEYTTVLNTQETLKIFGGSDADLTGTQVFSDNGTVAVFSGSSGVNIPAGVFWQDLLEEQLPPRSSWGMDYAVVKFQPRSNEPDLYRILADKDATVVNITGDLTNTYNLNEGEFVEFETAGNFSATGNEAFLIAHFLESANSNTGNYDQSVFPGGYQATNNCSTSVSATDLADPLLSYIVPIDQYRSRYTFLTPFTYAWDMLTVIGPSADWDTILLDGSPIPAPTVFNAELSYARFLVEDGAHYIASDVAKFGIEVYGYDCRVSYGHAGGLSLGVINVPPPPQD